MPKIPQVERQQSIPGVSGSVKTDVGSAGMVGRAAAGFGESISRAALSIGNEIEKRKKELQEQEDDNYLIEEGGKITKGYIEFKQNLEKDPEYLSGNYKGMSAALGKFTQEQTAAYANIAKDRPKLLNKIKEHIISLDNNAAIHFSTLAGSRIKDNGIKVRKTDLITSQQLARTGDYETAHKNYDATLNAQLQNGTLSKEQYALEKLEGRSAINEDYLNAVAEIDPVSAQSLFKVMKANKTDLQAEAIDRLEKVLKPAAQRQKGNAIGRGIFNKNTDDNIESMINTAKGKGLDPETEKHAIDEIKDSWNIRKTNEAQVKDNAIKKVNSVLVPIALKGNGMNKQSDLTPMQWAELTRDHPEYAQKLQDSMRREQNETARLARAEAREDRVAAAQIRQANKEWQGSNETNIMLAPDFAIKDLGAELATGQINNSQYTRLLEMQAKKDPLKNTAVTAALSRVNTGESLSSALGVGNKSELAIWKQKYSDLIKAFAYNNYDDPNFETRLSEFMEKHVLSRLVTGLFTTDKTDRAGKFKTAQDIAGSLPVKGKGGNTTSPTGITKSGKPYWTWSDGTNHYSPEGK